MTDPVRDYGWTALTRDLDALLASLPDKTLATPVKVDDIKLPDTEVARQTLEYARKELPEQTFNHSMRVWYYGIAIARQFFPSWPLSSPNSPNTTPFEETYLLTCLLHDIGTTDKNISATLMSFEFYGGLLVLDLLQKEGAKKEQAESVAEAVIRHQDLGTTGTLTTIGALIQFATIFDNMGFRPELVHQATIENVVKHYPRKQWSSCFSKTIKKENGLKPWAHTTHLGEEDFPNGVLGNKLMEPYDA